MKLSQVTSFLSARRRMTRDETSVVRAGIVERRIRPPKLGSSASRILLLISGYVNESSMNDSTPASPCPSSIMAKPPVYRATVILVRNTGLHGGGRYRDEGYPGEICHSRRRTIVRTRTRRLIAISHNRARSSRTIGTIYT